jgi:hypothetical protein
MNSARMMSGVCTVRLTPPTRTARTPPRWLPPPPFSLLARRRGSIRDGRPASRTPVSTNPVSRYSANAAAFPSVTLSTIRRTPRSRTHRLTASTSARPPPRRRDEWSTHIAHRFTSSGSSSQRTPRASRPRPLRPRQRTVPGRLRGASPLPMTAAHPRDLSPTQSVPSCPAAHGPLAHRALRTGRRLVGPPSRVAQSFPAGNDVRRCPTGRFQLDDIDAPTTRSRLQPTARKRARSRTGR